MRPRGLESVNFHVSGSRGRAPVLRVHPWTLGVLIMKAKACTTCGHEIASHFAGFDGPRGPCGHLDCVCLKSTTGRITRTLGRQLAHIVTRGDVIACMGPGDYSRTMRAIAFGWATFAEGTGGPVRVVATDAGRAALRALRARNAL